MNHSPAEKAAYYLLCRDLRRKYEDDCDAADRRRRVLMQPILAAYTEKLYVQREELLSQISLLDRRYDEETAPFYASYIESDRLAMTAYNAPTSTSPLT